MFSRIALLWWAIVFVTTFPIVQYRPNIKLIFNAFFIAIIGLMLLVQYQIRANIALFNASTIGVARPAYIINMYWNTIIEKRPVLLNETFKVVTPIIARENYQYMQAMLSPEYQNATRLYKQKVISYIKANPVRFIVSKIKNIQYLWEKSSLFYYEDPFAPKDKPFIYAINALFLALGVMGIFLNMHIKANSSKEMLLYFSLTFILYNSLFFSLVTPEERYTLISYPLVTLFVGFTISKFLNLGQKLLLRSKIN
jgi:hypothetical protein